MPAPDPGTPSAGARDRAAKAGEEHDGFDRIDVDVTPRRSRCAVSARGEVLLGVGH